MADVRCGGLASNDCYTKQGPKTYHPEMTSRRFEMLLCTVPSGQVVYLIAESGLADGFPDNTLVLRYPFQRYVLASCVPSRLRANESMVLAATLIL